MTLKKGTRVIVTTFNRGLPVYFKRPAKPEIWRGVIMGPSPYSDGWFLVKRAKSFGTYSVPRREIAIAGVRP